MTDRPDREDVALPLAEERIHVERHRRVSGRVRVSTRVVEETRPVDIRLEVEEVAVERVPVGTWIDAAPEPRTEGDVTIIPVVEEVPVVVTRLRLVEEIRIVRRRTDRHIREEVTTRRTDAVVERLPADAGDETPPTQRTNNGEHP